ncbi:MAG: glycosyltransferase [Candidatus Nanoarchaeia archaeon]|nr:glycosyltransferase [Candidatus Nanoarchaeia archaeon]
MIHSNNLKLFKGVNKIKIDNYLKIIYQQINRYSNEIHGRKKIAIFSPSKYGLGHFHQSDILNRRINEKLSNYCLSLHLTDLTPSKKVPENTIKIPNYSDILWSNIVNLEEKKVRLNKEQLSFIRKDILKKFIDLFSPDIILFDYYPFIHSNEIFSEFYKTIAYWKKENSHGRLICLYRGILGYNSERMEPGYRERVIKTMKKQIDFVFILADPDERFFIREELWFLNKEFYKFKYLGYITDIKQCDPPNKKQIICQVGGGIDGDKLIEIFCKCMKIIEQIDDSVIGIVILGPTFPEKRKKQILEDYKNVKTLIFKPGVDELYPVLKKSDLIISMGGYNSVVEAANLEIPSIIVPREKEIKHEQYLNAMRFYQYGLIDEIIEMERLEVKNLLPSIFRYIYKKEVKPIKMCGLDSIIDEICTIWNIVL